MSEIFKAWKSSCTLTDPHLGTILDAHHFHTHVGNLARSRSCRNESPSSPRGRGSLPAGVSRAQDRSRFARPPHRGEPPGRIASLPRAPPRPVVRTRWRLQASERPGATPTTAGRDTNGYPPSVVGAVRASVQRSRELLRERPAWLGVRATVRSVSAHPCRPLFRGFVGGTAREWYPEIGISAIPALHGFR